MADVKEQLRVSIRKVFGQLTKGCGRAICSNPLCASNPQMDKILSFQQAKELSIQWGSQILSSSHSEFELCTPAPPYFTLDQIKVMVENAEQNQDFLSVRKYVGEILHKREALNQSFLMQGVNGIATNEQSGVHYEQARISFEILEESIAEAFHSGIDSALMNLKQDLRYSKSTFEQPNNLRQFVTLLQDPVLFDPSYYKTFLVPFSLCIANLPQISHQILVNWLARFPLDQIRFYVISCQSMISMRALQEDLVPTMTKDETIHGGVEFLQLLYSVNEKLNEPLPYSDFYNDVVNERLMDKEELVQNFVIWKENQEENRTKFSLCTYFFILNPYIKSQILLIDSKVKQYELGRRNFLDFLRPGRGDLVLRVERQHIIVSALAEMEQYLEHDVTYFKRKLRVKFVGEEGVDEGGVQKEFFQLIVRELFDPNFGMFVCDKTTGRYWINHLSHDIKEFQLIGLVLGLAIYNGVILDIHFPFVMYKKLMGVPLCFDDVKEVDPKLWNGLNQLLTYDKEDVEEVFGLYFAVSYDNYGESIKRPLKENGESIAVSHVNKEEYVNLYWKWILEHSIQKQFDAFITGFKYVCNGFFFKLFRVEEVELMICGDPELDFNDLENVTIYDGGYDEDSETVRNFWEVIHSLSHEEKKQFLSFTTGSDRAPIGGLKNLQFVITKHGEDDDRLPQAHTCFNVLLLPPYSTKEKLRDRLLLATKNATGFGML